MKLCRLPFVLLFALGAASRLVADIALAPLFRDGAVLQRDRPIVVWGQAAAAEKVEVTFRRQTATVITRADGRWQVTLKAEPASPVPSELTASGANTVTVRDVLVGDVWLCSGQSNMAMLVRNSADAEREMAAARFPLIRHFKVPTTVAGTPATEVGGSWASCSPETVGSFSAVAYYFARELHQKNGVPIGLVNSSWGGTQIEGWISEPALRADPAWREIQARWEKTLADYPAAVQAHESQLAKWTADEAAAKAAGKRFARAKPRTPEGPGSRWLPAGIYNGMIAPLVPFGLRGVIWYQGETNAARHAEYASLFTALIKQWRADFGPDLPFYFVQLANFEAQTGNDGDTWAYLREAQARALKLPATGMAVTIDIGEPKDIHPKNKQEVGRRLALHARRQVLGERIETDGPIFLSAKRDGAAMRVSFSHATGLKLEPAKDDGRVSFEIAGADQKFVPAEARVDGQTLLVSAPSVTTPVAVRYAWRNSPDARLFNRAGLPAAPFRSDKWK
ncbi:MAG: sialate O-acetylesterase [Verrucomicrobia bacterium]|nr:sialate O-acetylesterase [Verrucomicrobiota bacterium]